MLFKNWHFMCFPKYDTELFIHKITDLGKKPPSRVNNIIFKLILGVYVKIKEDLQRRGELGPFIQ